MTLSDLRQSSALTSGRRRLSRAASLLGGAAIIAAAFAVHPATANVHSAKPDKTCASSDACLYESNYGSGPGILGTGTSGDGIVASSQNGAGLRSASSNYDAVNATTLNPSKTKAPRSGVFGYDASTDGGNLNNGVAGLSVNGTGVRGASTSGVGVDARSPNYIAVNAYSANYIGANVNGGYNPNGFPSLSVVGPSGNKGGYLIAGCAYDIANPCNPVRNAAAYWVDVFGNGFYAGNLYVNACNCSRQLTRTQSGVRVTSFASRVTQPTIEDEGQGRLIAGRARIDVSRDFAATTDPSRTYLVFVTSEGDSHGLFVTDKSVTGFTVRETQGGRSNLTFDYRIVAKPFDQPEQRLPIVHQRSSRP